MRKTERAAMGQAAQYPGEAGCRLRRSQV